MRSLRTLLLVLSLGCGAGEVTLTRFEAFDPKALNAEFTSPTGELTDLGVKDLLAETFTEDLKLAAKGVGRLLAPILDDDAGTSGSLQSALTVTSSDAYLRLSCPGPVVDEPDLDFGHGEIRVDAPGILPSKAALKDGDVLLTFKSCVSSRLTVVATTSAYYDVKKGMIFELDLGESSIDNRRVDLQPLKFRVSAKGAVEVLVETSSGTFVVDVAGLPKTLSVRDANTTVTCTLGKGKATCDLGGHAVTFELPASAGGA